MFLGLVVSDMPDWVIPGWSLSFILCHIIRAHGCEMGFPTQEVLASHLIGAAVVIKFYL